MVLPRLFIKAVTPIASIFLLLTGVIQLRAQVWGVGVFSILLAMVIFIFSMRLLENAPFTNEEIEALRPFVIPVASWTIIISLLSISVSYVMDDLRSAETDRIATIAWVVGVVLGFVTVWGNGLWAPLGWKTLRAKLTANRLELLIVFLVVILAFVVRTINLSTHPYPWSGDEASIGSEARRILRADITNFFETGWSSQPNWSFVPTAIAEMIFGDNIIAVRMTSVLAGTLAVLFVYLTGRELFNPTIGLTAAAFLATLPYNLHFSRVGVNNVVDSLMSAFVFWLLAKAIKKDDPRYYYSAGAAAGLCLYTYAGTRLVLILAALVLLYLMIRQKRYFSAHWVHLIAFSAAALISAAPQVAFFAQHRDIFMGRLGQEGILFNGWLAQQAALTGKSEWAILFEQFKRTTLVFVASPAPGNFFNSPHPYLTVLGSILLLLGMAYSLAYLLEPRYFILLIWFWAVIVLGGMLTLNPPANTRLLMTSPAVALFMALGAFKVLEYLQRFRIMPERLVVPVLILLAGIIAYQNIHFYLFEYRNNAYFEDANGEYAMEVGLMAKARGEDLQIYVMGQPRVFSGFPTLMYIAPNNPRADLNPDNMALLELPANRETGFFAIPENRPLLEQIRQRYPGGESGLVYRKTKPNEVLFEYYILSPRNSE